MNTLDRLTTALADRYRIARELGAGGMATVYLAHDLKHDRDVAIKVLHPDLGAALGGERFLSEIKTTAKLQHPHILPLLDSGEAEGLLFYVMPYVSGETLRDRLSRERQLPVEDALRIAREVADALNAAHALGIIHRDIKPENILLQGGHALVADFGIALAVQTAGGARMTQTGLSLGTPQYMSPEQAMGEKVIDARSDIYALAAVTYEMLVGEAPFTGPSVQAIVARVMTEDPRAISSQRKAVPAGVEAAVLRALEKLPADRFATAAEFAAALSATSTAPRAAAPRAERHRAWTVAAITGAAFCVAAGWLIGRRAQLADAAMGAPTQLALMIPDFGGSSTGLQRQIDITPDGGTILYDAVVDGRVRVKSVGLDGRPARVLEGVQPDLADFYIAPDGKSFIAANQELNAVFRYPIGGGTGRPLPRALAWNQRGAWATDGTLWASDQSSINAAITKVTPDDNVSHPFGKSQIGLGIAQVLPGDRQALVVRQPNGTATGTVELMDLRDGTLKQLLDVPVAEVRYTVGHLVYVLGDGTLIAQPFDAAKGKVTGSPVTIATGVTLTGSGVAQYAVSANGIVAYVVEAGRSLVLADRTGATRQVGTQFTNFHQPRFAPDGRRIAVDFNSADGRDV